MPKPRQKQKEDRLEIASMLYVKNVWVEYTPKYYWTTALKEAGYSEIYSDSNCSKLWNRAQPHIEREKQNHVIKLQWDQEYVDCRYRSLLDECIVEHDRTNAKGCLDSMSRRLAGFTDRIASTNEEITSLTPEQEAINDKAVRLAKIKLSETTQDAPESTISDKRQVG